MFEKKQVTELEESGESASVLDGLKRVVIPKSEIENGEVDVAVLKAGIDLDDPWQEIMPKIKLTKEDVIEEFLKADLRTVDDLLAKPEAGRVAIQKACGLVLADIIRSAKLYKNERSQ